MSYHMSNLGSFAGSAGNPLKPAHYADLDGFVPQPGDKREDFLYNGDAAYESPLRDGYVGDVPWDEWVESARQATTDAENDARVWREQ